MAIAAKPALSAHRVVSAMTVANAVRAMAVVASAMRRVQMRHKAKPLLRAASGPVSPAKVDVAIEVAVAAATTVAHARTKQVPVKCSKPRWALSKAMPLM